VNQFSDGSKLVDKLSKVIVLACLSHCQRGTTTALGRLLLSGKDL
jgi:hypothetical protein